MKVVSFICLMVSLFILPKQLHSQSCINWQQIIGGVDDERGSDIAYDEATNTYWACGYITTKEDSSNVLSKNGWLANFDENGNLLQEIEIKEPEDLTFNKIDLLDDRVVVCGNIFRAGNLEPSLIIYSFNTAGELLNSLADYAVGEVTALKILNDGNFIVALNSLDKIFLYQFNSSDLSIRGVSRFGGSNIESVNDIIVDDDRVIMAGLNSSNDGSASNHLGSRDVWLFEIDVTLRIIKEKSFGGISSETAIGMVQTADGGLIVLAEILNADGDISTSYGNGDYWVFKLDEDWNIVWEQTFGGGSSDNPKTIAAFSNGDVLVGGITISFDNDITENFGFFDTWLARLNGQTGDLIWSQSIGGNDLDFTNQININSKDEIVAIGNTDSNSIGCKDECTNPHEFQNIWVYSVNEEVILDVDDYSTAQPNTTKFFCVDGWVSLTNASNKIKNYKIYDIKGLEHASYKLLPNQNKKVFVDALKNELVILSVVIN